MIKGDNFSSESAPIENLCSHARMTSLPEKKDRRDMTVGVESTPPRPCSKSCCSSLSTHCAQTHSGQPPPQEGFSKDLTLPAPPIATKYDLQSHPQHPSSAFYSSTAPKLKHVLIYKALFLTFVFQSMCQARVWRRNVFSLRRGRALPPTINNH